jgi:restriction system protein
MALWLVRAGKYGEREDFALRNKVAVAGWDELSDLSSIKTRPELRALLKSTYPDQKEKIIRNWEGQLWRFRHEFKKGDLIAIPLKHRPVIAIGEISGDYHFEGSNPEGFRNLRPVNNWQEFPRNTFDQDLLYSFGSLLAICQIQRNRAEERVKSILAGKRDHGGRGEEHDSGHDEDEELDLERISRDQISQFIIEKFKGHGLAQLVGAILVTQGYQIQISPAGPDGGVDILAGKGSLGFEPPKLAVQVKSSDSPIDVGVLRELSGVMGDFGANLGLIVAWGGFRGIVEREAAKQYFKIRLWDADDVVQMIEDNYENLPASIQADLPLKRIWTLVQEEEGE